MIKANFKVDGVIKKIQRMVDLSNDMRPVLNEILGDIQSPSYTIIGGIRSQFVSQGSFYGSQWSDLKPSYAVWKRKKYPGKTILRASDRLFNAVTNQKGSEGATVRVLEWRRLTYGVDASVIKYAKYHMTGTGKMKARPFLGIRRDQKEAWQKLIAQYLLELKTGVNG